MLSKDVLRVLGITRPTLTKYVKTGIIRVKVLPNKRYDYNEVEDVPHFRKWGCNISEQAVSISPASLKRQLEGFACGKT